MQSLLNDWYQVIKEQEKAEEALASRLDERIQQLTDYLRDPNYEAFKRNLRTSNTIGHSFEYLQNINQHIAETKKNIESLTEKQKDAANESEVDSAF